MIKGIILLLIAEFFFSFSTIIAKYLYIYDSGTTPFEATFFRFFIGTIIAVFYLVKEKRSLIPVKKKFVILRGIFSALAVFLTFFGLRLTTVTNANMLSMTYPVIIFIISPFINKEKSPKITFLFLITTMLGAYIVINPNFQKINFGDLLCLLSGITAAFGMTSLREASKYDNVFIIIFYQMVLALFFDLFFIIPNFKMPSLIKLVLLIGIGLCGAMGQILLTTGYKYVSAKTGSLFSTSKIIYSLIMGLILFNDPLNLRIISGAVLIFSSIICVGLISKKEVELIEG